VKTREPVLASGNRSRLQLTITGGSDKVAVTNFKDLPVRDQEMRVSWRSDDETAQHVVEFVKLVCNATITGFQQREHDLPTTKGTAA